MSFGAWATCSGSGRNLGALSPSTRTLRLTNSYQIFQSDLVHFDWSGHFLLKVLKRALIYHFSSYSSGGSSRKFSSKNRGLFFPVFKLSIVLAIQGLANAQYSLHVINFNSFDFLLSLPRIGRSNVDFACQLLDSSHCGNAVPPLPIAYADVAFFKC